MIKIIILNNNKNNDEKQIINKYIAVFVAAAADGVFLLFCSSALYWNFISITLFCRFYPVYYLLSSLT